MNLCRCGSGLEGRPLYDARMIYCGRVCNRCEEEKMSEFRPEIFTDPGYYADEDIEPEDA